MNQKDTNVLSSECFEVKILNESEGITLEKAYPVTDEEGMKEKGYTFTIKNTCDTLAYYQVNLEEIKLPDEMKRISDGYIKVSLNDSAGKELDSYSEVEPTIKEDVETDISHKLTSGSLEPNGEETYTLKLWMDYDTPAIDDVMNATFQSKISIITSYMEEEKLENTIEVTSESKNDTYSKEKEVIQIKGKSTNYDIIEYSFDNEVFNPLTPGKEVTIEKEETKEGTYSVYFKDEVGNIQEGSYETSKLDQTSPEIEVQEESDENGALLTITFKDLKSGLKEYRIKDGVSTIDLEDEWTPITNESPTITYPSTENKTITIQVKDQLDNLKEEEYEITKADIEGPSIKVTNPSEGKWTKEALTITITAEDEISGVEKFYYKKQGEEEWKEIENQSITGKNGSATITINETTDTTYEFKVEDKMKNPSETKNTIVKIDKDIPTVSNKTSATNWGTTNEISITVTDIASGIASYAFDKNSTTDDNTKWIDVSNFPTTEQTYKGSANSNGEWYAHIKDQAGNIKNESITVSKVDTSAGSASFAIGSQTAGAQGSGWYKALSVKVTPTDGESGIKSAKYCTTTGSSCSPGNAASISNGTFNVSLGNDANAQKVCVTVTNGANIESGILCDSTLYKVDGANPSFTNVTLTASGTSLVATIAGASDSHSKVKTYSFTLSNGTTQTSSTNSTTFTNGNKGFTRGTSYTVTASVIDTAGNQSSTRTSGSATIPYQAATDVLKGVTQVTSGDGLYKVTPTLSGWTTAELRYAGANPNNYVTFNGESAGWRIIGLVNTPNGQRIKLIKKAYYNASIKWNSNNTNNWTTSSLQSTLNTTYYNGMTTDARNMIDENVTWNLGGTDSYSSALVTNWYTYERGTTVYTGRPTTWTGKIGLMYPSDYGWATSGGNTTNRASCLAKALYVWTTSSVRDCKNNDWLYDSSNYQWTLTPRSSTSNTVFYVTSTGYVYDYDVTYSNAVRPVVYLKSNVLIQSGNGSSGSPFILQLG